MTRTVFCRKYQQELEGLDQPPFPGQRGQDIFENISRNAWDDWLAHQTMLINERRLNLMDRGTKVFLNEEMDKFFSNQDVAQAEGFVPPKT